MNNNNNKIPKEPDFSWLFKDIKKEHPELKAGQFWTIFRPEINNEEIDETETGQIVLIMEIEDNNIFIVPVHATERTRTILDPLISEECHNLHSYPIVAVVTMAQNIGKEPFKTARFVGEITKEGLEIVKESYNKYLNAIGELAIVQYKDAHDIELTDEEEAVATKAGIYKLCPVNGDIDSLIEFNNEISDILQPWHVLAMAEMFTEEEEKQASEVAEKSSLYREIKQKVSLALQIIFGENSFNPVLSGAGNADDLPGEIAINKDIRLVFEYINDNKIVVKIDSILAMEKIPVITFIYEDGKEIELPKFYTPSQIVEIYDKPLKGIRFALEEYE